MKQKFRMKMGMLAAFFMILAVSFGSTDAVKAAEAPDGTMTDMEKGDSESGFWQYTVYRNLVTITKYTGADSNVTVPSVINGLPVATIGSRAFERNTWLISVTIPDSVLTVGDYAFSGCENLRSVNGMAGVTSINSGSFYNCVNLTSVAVSNALKSIGYQTFRGCSSLTDFKIPASVTGLGESCFRDSGLTSIAIPDNVETYVRLFQNCVNLRSVSIGANVTLNNNMFNGCTSLQEVAITAGTKVVSINSNAFYGCTALESISMPANVRTIGDYAFCNCTALKTLELSNGLLDIGEGAFRNCTALETLELSYGLLNIGVSAFRECVALKSVVIPNSVIKIGASAFRDCQGLESIEIPNSVTEIGSSLCVGSTVIKCYPGSAAEKYAEANKLTVEPMQAKFSTAVLFPEPTLYMKVGETQQLAYTLVPSDTTDAVVWQSSNTGILSINAIGEVVARKAGSVTVIATATSGIQGRVNIVVSDKLKSISFSRSSVTLLVGETTKQVPVLKDTGGNTRTDIIPVYTSSNPAIATVAADGTVTAVAEGQVTITAKAEGVSAEYKVTVAPKTAGGGSGSNKGAVSFAKKSMTVVIGQTITQKASVTGGLKVTSYISSNPNIASVTNAGKVTGLKTGTVTITAVAGSYRTAYTVKVVAAQATASGKTLKITTIPKAKVTVKAKKSVLGSSSKKGTANKKGILKIKFKKKIKGTVKITIQKSGYKKKTITKKF